MDEAAAAEIPSASARGWTERTGEETTNIEAAIFDELGLGDASPEMLADARRAVNRVQEGEPPAQVFEWFQGQYPEALIDEDHLPVPTDRPPGLSRRAAELHAADPKSFMKLPKKQDWGYNLASLAPMVGVARLLAGEKYFRDEPSQKRPIAPRPGPEAGLLSPAPYRKLASAVPMLPPSTRNMRSPEAGQRIADIVTATSPGPQADDSGLLGDFPVLEGMSERAMAFGQPIGSAVGGVFDLLGRLHHATAGAIRNIELSSVGLEPYNPLGAAWAGLTLARRDTMVDVLRDYGLEDPALLFVWGTMLDIMVDPLTYAGGLGIWMRAAKWAGKGIRTAALAGERTLPAVVAGPLSEAITTVRMARTPSQAHREYFKTGNESLLRRFIEIFDKPAGEFDPRFPRKQAQDYLDNALKDLDEDQVEGVMTILSLGERRAMVEFPQFFRAGPRMEQMAQKLEMSQEEARSAWNRLRMMTGEAEEFAEAGITKTAARQASAPARGAQAGVERLRNLMYAGPKGGTGQQVRQAVQRIEKWERNTIEPMLRKLGLESMQMHYAPVYYLRHLPKADVGWGRGPIRTLSSFLARYQDRHLEAVEPTLDQLRMVRRGVSTKGRLPGEFRAQRLPTPVPGQKEHVPFELAFPIRWARAMHQYKLDEANTSLLKEFGHLVDQDLVKQFMDEGMDGVAAARKALVKQGLDQGESHGWDVLELGEEWGRRLSPLRLAERAKPGGKSGPMGDTLWGETRDMLEKASGVKVGEYIALPKPVHRTLDAMLDPPKIGEFLRFYDGMQGWFKKAVTVWWPAFHSRNGMSNLFLNWMGGVTDPLAYMEAHSFQKGKRMQKLYGIPGTNHVNGQDIQNAIESAGLTRAGLVEDFAHHFGTDSPVEAEKALRRVHANPAIWNVPEFREALGKAKGWERIRVMLDGAGPGRFGTSFGGYIEDNAKIAHVLFKLEQGKSLDSAITSAKHWLYDYRAMSPWERNWGRRIFPFYAWQRNNVPRMLEALFVQPQKFAQTNHFMRNAAGSLLLAADPDSRQDASWHAAMPDFMARVGGFVWGVDEYGHPKITRGYGGLPFEDLRAVMPFVNPGDWVDHYLSMTTPFAGWLTSLIGYSSFTGESTRSESSDNYYLHTDAPTAWAFRRLEAALKFAETRSGRFVGSAIKDYREENLGITEKKFIDKKGNERTAYTVKNPAWYASMVAMVSMLGAGRVGSTIRRFTDPRKTTGEKIWNFLGPLNTSSIDVTRRINAYWAGEGAYRIDQLEQFDKSMQAWIGGEESLSVEKLDKEYSRRKRSMHEFFDTMRKGISKDTLNDRTRAIVQRSLYTPEELAMELFRDGDPAWGTPGEPPLTEFGVPDWERFYKWRDEFRDNPWEKIKNLPNPITKEKYMQDISLADAEEFNENIRFLLDAPSADSRIAEEAGKSEIANFIKWREYAYNSYGIYRDTKKTPRWRGEALNAQAEKIQMLEDIERSLLEVPGGRALAKLYREEGITFERVGPTWKMRVDANGNPIKDPEVVKFLRLARNWDRLYKNPARNLFKARHPELAWFGLTGPMAGPSDPSIIARQPPPSERPALPSLPLPPYSRPGMEQQFSGAATG